MRSIFYKLQKYKNETKSRFDLNQVALDAPPTKNGVLPHLEEQLLEYPNHGKNERILIYGTNSSGDIVIVRLETRTIKSDSLIRGQVIIKKVENGTFTLYTFDEIDWNSDYANKYKVKGLSVEIVSPVRKLRITFRGMMDASPLGSDVPKKEVFIKFNLFWTPISGVVDGKYNFDPRFLSKDLSETCSRNLSKNVSLADMLEDRYEQYGQMIGLISVENQPEEELFLWGSRYKVFLHDQPTINSTNQSEKSESSESISTNLGPCHSMRLLAMSPLRGPAISLGYVSNSKCGYRYGSSFTIPPMAWNVKSTNIGGQDFDQLLHLENIKNVKEYKVRSEGKRDFDLKVSKVDRLTTDIVFGDIEMKGCPATCILIDERNGLLYDTIPAWLKPIPRLMSLDASKTKEEPQRTEYVYSLADVSGGHELTSGGKGSSLVILTEVASSYLSNVQFIVPKGAIVSTKSYKYLLENNRPLQESIKSLQRKVWSSNSDSKKNEIEEKSQNVINKFKSSPLPEFLVEQLRRKLHRIFGNFEETSFSVRSSAVGEDSDDMSAAGQMDTFLGIKGIDSITSCIMKCWSSQFTTIALNYRKNYGQVIDTNMSVVIQEMVDCDSAGVMFTVDPVSGNEKSIVITSNFGLGESVVSASAEPDTITLDVDLKARTVKGIQNIKIGGKSTQITLATAEVAEDEKTEMETNLKTKEGTETKLVDSQKSTTCSITEEQAINLGRIGLLLHDIWRNARDIEWGIKDGTIYLFQSRPVTNLDRYSQWELMHELDSAQYTERDYVTRANVGEVLPGAMSHLCHTFVIAGWGVPGFTRFRHIMGATDNMFVPYILSFFAVVNNTFFINLKNKHFAFGTEEGAGTEYAILGHRLTDEELLSDVSDYYAMDPKNSSRWFNLKVLSFIFKESMMAKSRLKKFTKKLRDFQLIHPGQKFDSSEQLFKYILDNSWQNNYGMLLHGQVTQTSILSSEIVRKMLSKENENMEEILLDLSTVLGNCTDVVSAGVPSQMKSIMESIEDPVYFKALSDEDALKYLKENDKTAKKFKDLIDTYGHRGLKEFDPHTKVWAMDPGPLIKSLKAGVGNSKSKTTQSNGQLNGKIPSGATKVLEPDTIDQTLDSLHTKTKGSLRKVLKHAVIPFARASVGWREQSKSFTVWLIHRYREAFWLLADIMSRKEGRIPDPDLLFHLKLEEIAILVKERNPSIVDRAIKRRKVMKIMDKMNYEEITRGPNVKPRTVVTTVPSDGSVSIKGTTVCAGKIEARVCVATSLDDASDIQEGDILITYSTDIGWSPFFPLLAGLATEIGGLVSHGAVIAREFGLPCLVGVEGAPSLFKTGDRALLDSVSGSITKL